MPAKQSIATGTLWWALGPILDKAWSSAAQPVPTLSVPQWNNLMTNCYATAWEQSPQGKAWLGGNIGHDVTRCAELYSPDDSVPGAGGSWGLVMLPTSLLPEAAQHQRGSPSQSGSSCEGGKRPMPQCLPMRWNSCKAVFAGFVPHSVFQPSSPSHTAVRLICSLLGHLPVQSAARWPPSPCRCLLHARARERRDAGAKL